jgi:hypothetical protein
MIAELDNSEYSQKRKVVLQNSIEETKNEIADTKKTIKKMGKKKYQQMHITYQYNWGDYPKLKGTYAINIIEEDDHKIYVTIIKTIMKK